MRSVRARRPRGRRRLLPRVPRGAFLHAALALLSGHVHPRLEGASAGEGEALFLILQSTFPSLAVFASGHLAPAFLLRDRFDNEAALREFRGPVLVIHGRRDEMIPFRLGERLAAASRNATFRLYDCAHGCWEPDRVPFWRDADALLSQSGLR